MAKRKTPTTGRLFDALISNPVNADGSPITRGRLLDQDGFYLEVSGASRLGVHRLPARFGGGQYVVCNFKDTTLHEFRQMQTVALRKLAQGINPSPKATAVQTKPITLLDDLLRKAEHNGNWKPDIHGPTAKRPRQCTMEQNIRLHLPTLIDMPTADITAEMIKTLLADKWRAVHPVRGHGAAVAVIVNLKTIFNYAIKLDPTRFPLGSPIPRLKLILPPWDGSVRSHPAAPWEMIGVTTNPAPGFQPVYGDLIYELHAQPFMAAHCAAFLILTCCGRSNEVRGLRWQEIKDDCWSVALERRKRRKKIKYEHEQIRLVPIPPAAMRELEWARRQNPHAKPTDLVFPGDVANKRRHPGYENATEVKLSGSTLVSAIRRVAGFDRFTIHGFRSTVTDWAEAQGGVYDIAVQIALDHTTGDATHRAYQRNQRYEQRMEMAIAWSTYLGIVPVQPALSTAV